MSSSTPHGDPVPSPETLIPQSVMRLPSINDKFATNSGLTHSLSIKLDEKNFLLWSQQVNGVITAHDLHRFVVSPKIPLKYASEEDRLVDKPSDEYKKWLTQDQMLFTWLLSSLSDGILPRVLGCSHAFQVWDKVHKHFHSLMKAKVRQLRSELKNTKKVSRSISEYLLRIKAIIDSLIAVGDSISEQDHIDAILEGLPEEYNSFVMLIYSRLDSPSVEDLESLLMVQEAQFEKFRQELAIPNASANVAQSSGNSNALNHNVQIASHADENSYNNTARGGNAGDRGRFRGRGGNRPTCQLCGKFGHDVLRCWYRFDQTFNPSPQMQNAQQFPYTNYRGPMPQQSMVPNPATMVPNAAAMRPSVNMAALPQYMPRTQEFFPPTAFDTQEWYPDSGASHHLTANAQNLTQSVPFQGQTQVVMGNGQGI